VGHRLFDAHEIGDTAADRLHAQADLDGLDRLDAHHRHRQPCVELPVPLGMSPEADRAALDDRRIVLGQSAPAQADPEAAVRVGRARDAARAAVAAARSAVARAEAAAHAARAEAEALATALPGMRETESEARTELERRRIAGEQIAAEEERARAALAEAARRAAQIAQDIAHAEQASRDAGAAEERLAAEEHRLAEAEAAHPARAEAAAPLPPSPAPAPGEQEKFYRPSRDGRRLIAGHFDPKVAKQLKLLAAEEETTVQALLEEALNLLFIKKGKDVIKGA